MKNPEEKTRRQLAGLVLVALTAGTASPACSGSGPPSDSAGHLPDPRLAGGSVTKQAAEPAPPPPPPPAAPPPAVSSRKQAAMRSCAIDAHCGEGGFCDRDRCVPVSRFERGYGRVCETNHDCSYLPCIDGRCRSCRHDVECEVVRDLFDPRCQPNRATSGTWGCGNGILSLPGGMGRRPPRRR